MSDDPFTWIWRWGFMLHDGGWVIINRRHVIVAEAKWPRLH